MAPKIIAAIITFIIDIAVGVIVLATMLIAMNGYSESDASWGLGAFVILAFVVALIMGIGAFLLAGLLTKKQYSGIGAAIIPILVFSIVGAGLEVVAGGIGVAIAEFVRVNF